MQQQNEKYLPKIKPVFLQSLKGYGPAFEDEDFAHYLAKSLLSAANFMLEASKLAKELKEKDKAQKKLEEFIHHERALLHQKFDNLLKKAYPSFQSQNKDKYVQYLVALTQGQNGFAKYKEIFESLAGPNVKPVPPYFNEFKTAVTQSQKDKMWEIFKKNFPEYEKLSGSKYIDYLWSLMNKRGEDAAKLYPEIGRALSTPPQDPHTLPPYWNDYKTAQTEMDKDKCREAFRTNFAELHKQVGNKYIDFLFSLVRPEEAPRRHRDFIEGLANTAARFPPYWQEFQDKESRRHGDVREPIKKKHPEHCEGQYGAKFLEYINNLAHSDPQTHDAIMKEISQDTKLTPPKWYEFLRAELGDERLKKLEVIRRDPQFLTYIEYRKQRFEQYKQNYVGRSTTEQEQKQFNNMKMYVEQLTTIINLFQKLLYFNLYQSHFGQIFAFFEKDFDAYKKNNAARAAQASHETHEQKDTLPPRTQPVNQQNLATAPTNPQHHQQQNPNYMRQNAGYADSHSQGHGHGHSQQGHSANQMPTTSKDPYQSQSQPQAQPQVSSHHYGQQQQSQQQYPQHSTPTHSTHSAHSTHSTQSTAHQTPNLHSSQNLHQNTYQQQQQQRTSAYSQQPSHTTSQQQPANVAPTHSQQSRAPQTQNAPYSQPQPHAGGMPQKTNPLQSHTSGYQMGQQTQQQYPQTASQPQTSKYIGHTQPTTQHPQQNQYTNPHAPHHPQQTTQQTMHGQIPLQSPTKQNPLHAAQTQPPMKPQPQSMQPINQVQSPGLKQNVLPHQAQPKTMGAYDMMKMQSAPSGYEQQQQQQQVPPLQPTEPLGTSQPSKYQYKPTYDNKSGMSSHSTAATSQKSQLPSSSQTFSSVSSGQMQIENSYSQPQVQAPLQTHVQPHVQPHIQPHVQSHAQPHVQPHVPPHVQPQQQPQLQTQPQAQPQKAPIIQNQKADMKRPRFTEKEKFDNFNLDGITLEDGERRLGEVYKKLKNPYGNYEIIDNFIQNLYTELAESEAEHKVEKRLKTNPDPSQEINIFPDNKAKTTMPIEQPNNVKAPQTFVQQPVNPFENDITDIKMDDRFKVEDKGNHSAPSFDLVIYKNNDGIISFHDKLVVRLEKDAIPKITIQEMANLSDFFIEYKDMLEDALTKGRLKEVLELWLEFIEKCAMKLESKLSAFDDLFG